MTESAQSNINIQAAAVLEKLAARQEARQTEREHRLQQLEAEADPREDINDFLASFAADHSRLRERCKSLQQQQASTHDEPSKQALLQQLEDVSSEIGKLEQSTADAAYFLPPYELRTSTAHLQELRSQVAAIKQQLQPKRKFAFAKAVTRKPAAAVAADTAGGSTATAAQQGTTPTDQAAGSTAAAVDSSSNQAAAAAAAAAQSPPPPSAHDLQLIASGQGCMGLRGQVVVKTPAQLDGQGFVLHDLCDCTVYLLGHMPALRLQQLQRCRVYAGPVGGATFVSGACCCTLMVASQQVRIHDAQSCDFYLRVRSRPIIEHSSRLRFAPYPIEALLDPQQQQQQFSQQLQALLGGAQLSEDSGLWQQVDDFGWVKASQSPHWSVLPEQERQQPAALPTMQQQQQEQQQQEQRKEQQQQLAETAAEGGSR